MLSTTLFPSASVIHVTRYFTIYVDALPSTPRASVNPPHHQNRETEDQGFNATCLPICGPPGLRDKMVAKVGSGVQ